MLLPADVVISALPVVFAVLLHDAILVSYHSYQCGCIF